MKKSALFLTSLSLLISPACSGPQKIETIRLTPPADLLQPCRVDDYRPERPTVADLVASRDAYREALSLCDADKTQLRAWVSEG